MLSKYVSGIYVLFSVGGAEQTRVLAAHYPHVKRWVYLAPTDMSATAIKHATLAEKAIKSACAISGDAYTAVHKDQFKPLADKLLAEALRQENEYNNTRLSGEWVQLEVDDAMTKDQAIAAGDATKGPYKLLQHYRMGPGWHVWVPTPKVPCRTKPFSAEQLAALSSDEVFGAGEFDPNNDPKVVAARVSLGTDGAEDKREQDAKDAAHAEYLKTLVEEEPVKVLPAAPPADNSAKPDSNFDDIEWAEDINDTEPAQ